MNMRTFHIIQTAFYLTVIAVLCAMIRRPYNELDPVLSKFYQRQQKDISTSIKQTADYMNWDMHQPGQRAKVEPYYNMVLRVDSAARLTMDYFDSVTSHPVLIKNLQNNVDTFTAFMLHQIPYDSATMKPLADEIMVDCYLPGVVKDKHLYHFLKSLSPGQRQLYTAFCKTNIYAVQLMITKRLKELGHSRCCFCYDSTSVFPLMSNPERSTGDTVHNQLILAAIQGKYAPTRYYSNNKQLAIKQYFGYWEGVAQNPGVYTVNGTIEMDQMLYSGLAVQSYPWSFTYRVAARGISLVHTTNQVCYRNVGNPVSVIIPGYAPEQIRLWSKQAKVANNPDGSRTITITDRYCDSVIIYAEATDARGHTSTVHAVRFAVKNLPDPMLTIDGKQTATITTAELQQPHRLYPICTDEDWPQQYSVIEYEMCLVSAGGQCIGTYSIEGNKLEIQADACKQLGAGGRIYISQAKAISGNGIVSFPAPMAIRVE